MTTDGLFRLAVVAIRRYSREPSTRHLSARTLAVTAINILAAETSPGEAALIASEAFADIAQAQRLEAAMLPHKGASR